MEQLSSIRPGAVLAGLLAHRLVEQAETLEVWRTREGAAVLIRPMHGADLPLLREFMRMLSAESSYKRFMSPRTPSDEEIRRWADVDPSHEYSLVAIAPGAGTLVAEARYVIETGGDAEFAIAIADRWQGQGLGRELLTRLIAAASCDGLRRLTGTALSTNKPLLDLARKLGFHSHRTPGAGWETTLTLDLDTHRCHG
jgi:acetyltransferase